MLNFKIFICNFYFVSVVILISISVNIVTLTAAKCHEVISLTATTIYISKIYSQPKNGGQLPYVILMFRFINTRKAV